MDLCADGASCLAMNDNMTSGNATNSTCLDCSNGGDEDGQISHKIVVAIFTSLLAFAIFVGNGLIIVSVSLVRKLRQPANYLIVSLAFSDFLVAIVVLPPTIVYDILGEWVFGPTICNIHVSFDVICCASSILNLVMISIDRYLMVTRPLTYPKKRTAKLMAAMICTAWILAGLVIFPALFGFTKNVTDDPAWIKIRPSGGFWTNDSECPAVVGYHTLAELEENKTLTYWMPYESENMHQFKVNFGKTYNFTKIRFSGNEDSIFYFQLQMATQNQSNTTTANFSLNHLQEGSITTPTPVTCMRVLLNGSETNLPENTSFEVFGELIRGKTCLISQQRWFTIYSTVGSFYIPLSVMLFMYYKIYVEASRFKARQRARSKSLTDQHHSIMSQPLRRKHTLITGDEDSSSDLTDYYYVYQHGNMQTSPKRETVISNLSPTKSFSPVDGLSPVEEPNRWLTATSRDDDVYEPLAPQVEEQNGSAENPQPRDDMNDVEHDILLRKPSSDDGVFEPLAPQVVHPANDQSESPKHSPNSNGGSPIKSNISEADTLTDDTQPFEVNGNIPNGNGKLSISRSTSWCKNLHYSTTSMNNSDTSVSGTHSNTNGRSCAGKTKSKNRNESLRDERIPENSPFVRRDGSLLSTRRSSTAAVSFNSIAKGAKRGSIFIRRRLSSTANRERLRNVKAIRTLGIIVVVFTFCWLPFFILTFIRPFVCEDPESKDCFPEWLVRLVLWLGYLNSALNPLIYVGFSSDLRETFRFLICCKCTNVDRRLAQIELRKAIEEERKQSVI